MRNENEEQLHPTDWETQKVLLKDFYGYGKSELAVVFSSMLREYRESLPEDVFERHEEVFDKVKEILSAAKKECSITVE